MSEALKTIPLNRLIVFSSREAANACLNGEVPDDAYIDRTSFRWKHNNGDKTYIAVIRDIEDAHRYAGIFWQDISYQSGDVSADCVLYLNAYVRFWGGSRPSGEAL